MTSSKLLVGRVTAAAKAGASTQFESFLIADPSVSRQVTVHV